MKGTRILVQVVDGFLPVFLHDHQLMPEGPLTGLVHLSDVLSAPTVC